MKEIKLLVKQIILNFKSIISDRINIILLLFIPLLMTLIPMFFIPLAYSLGVVVTGTVMLISFIIYQKVSLSFKKSTLYSNNKLSSGNRWLMNLSTIATLLIVSYMLVIFLIIVLKIFSEMNILLWGYRKYPTNGNHWDTFNLPFIYIYYQITLLTLITFSLSYFIEKFSNNANFYYILTIILFLLIVIFGGSFNNYFHEIEKGIDGRYLPSFDPSGSIYPPNIYIPSLFIPFFAPSQMITITGEMTKINGDNLIVWTRYREFSPWVWETKSMFSSMNGEIWKWNILWIVPYLHIIIWFLLGRLIDK